MTYARLRPMRSPILLPIRMNAAETSASSAIADCTPLTVVSRSRTTDEIDTFINDVSTTSTNIANARSNARRGLAAASPGTLVLALSVTRRTLPRRLEPRSGAPQLLVAAPAWKDLGDMSSRDGRGRRHDRYGGHGDHRLVPRRVQGQGAERATRPAAPRPRRP